ncbi:MAG: sulfatase-like hydrolase/transferase [Clostridia bacterium]|nr:sulfatase-like hydrolase/transferase [Clostridia bacterium]
MKKTQFKFNIKKRILPVLLVSVLTPLILFVAIPFEIFANNMDEFLFSLSSFYPYCILFGFLLAAGIAGALLFLPEKAYRICYALVLALSFLFFLQGTFLNFGADSLDGNNLGTNNVHIGLKILDAFIWLAVLGAAVALALIKDKKGIFAIVAVILSIVVVATQIITPVASTVKHPDVFMSRTERLKKENPDFNDKVLTDEKLTAVASGRNVIFFCVDQFDEYYAQTALDLNPDIYDGLDGFTWFRDNLSLFGHTFPSIAYMLSEKPYDMKESLRKDYLDNVYKDNRTLSVLYENGYSVNLYTQPYYVYNAADTLPDYVENISDSKQYKTTRPAKLTDSILSTAAYRCLPLFIKDLVNDVESCEFNECVATLGENGYYSYNCENQSVLENVIGAEFGDKGEKNFSFIHIEGCHDVCPDYTKPVPEKKRRKTAASVKRSFSIINEYLNALKEKGLYKDATIIITGDHPNTARDFVRIPKLDALFFKRSGESGTEIKQSYAPVAHENIWPAIFQSEKIERENNGTGLYEIAEYDPTRERKYIWQTYDTKECFEYVYTITGPGTNFDNWKLVDSAHYNRFIMT